MNQSLLPLMCSNSAFAVVRDALLRVGTSQPTPRATDVTISHVVTIVRCEVRGLAYVQKRDIISNEIAESIAWIGDLNTAPVFWSFRHGRDAEPKYLCGAPSPDTINRLLTLIDGR